MVFANFNYQTIRDTEGFAPPQYGGTLAVKHNTVAYTDTAAKALFTLPKGAVIVGWSVNVRTAFNSSGTDLLDIGNTGTGDAYCADLDVSSVATLRESTAAFVEAGMFTPLTDDTPITATFAQSVADASAGEADVCVFYYLN